MMMMMVVMARGRDLEYLHRPFVGVNTEVYVLPGDRHTSPRCELAIELRVSFHHGPASFIGWATIAIIQLDPEVCVCVCYVAWG